MKFTVSTVELMNAIKTLDGLREVKGNHLILKGINFKVKDDTVKLIATDSYVGGIINLVLTSNLEDGEFTLDTADTLITVIKNNKSCMDCTVYDDKDCLILNINGCNYTVGHWITGGYPSLTNCMPSATDNTKAYDIDKMIQALKSLKSGGVKSVIIDSTSELKPTIIKPIDNNDEQVIVCPIRLKKMD